LAVFLTTTAALRADERFDPLKHFPAPSMLYLSVESVSGLKQKLAATLAGRIVTHPDTSLAFGGLLKTLSERIEEETGPVRQVTGKGVFELLGMFEGRFALTVRGMGPAGPELAIAIELGDNRDDILGVLGRLRAIVEDEGGPLTTAKVGGADVVTWPSDGPPILQTVLGDHLLFVAGDGLLKAIADAYAGTGSGPTLGDSDMMKGLAKPLSVPGREVTLAIDVAAIRQLAMAFAGPNESAEIETVLRLTGLDRVGAIGKAVGFSGSASRPSFVVLTPKGDGGLQKVFRMAMPPIESLDGALEQIPRAAHEIAASRVAVGELLRGLDSLVRLHFPEAGSEIDELSAQLQQHTGLSLRDDLMQLGPITTIGFNVEPPAGGLFSDQLMLFRTAELEPYWKVGVTLAKRIGAEPQTIDVGDAKMVYLNPAAGMTAGGGLLGELLETGDPTELFESEEAVMGLIFGSVRLARTDLADGWSVVSFYPQAVRRYLSHYAKGKKLSDNAAFAKYARAKIVKSNAASVFRGGKSVLWGYNTFVTAANWFSSYLALVGVDAGMLPPAEEFLDATGMGYLQLRLRNKGLIVRGERPLDSSTTVLVAVAGTAVVAGMIVPVLSRGRGEAYKIQSMNNMKNIFAAALTYANKKHAYPFSPEGSIESFNLLLRSEAGEFLTPELFVRPDGFETPAEVGPNGSFRLAEENCSYEFAPRRRRAFGASKMLLWEKEPRGDVRLVLMTDGSIREMPEPDFQTLRPKTE